MLRLGAVDAAAPGTTGERTAHTGFATAACVFPARDPSALRCCLRFVCTVVLRRATVLGPVFLRLASAAFADAGGAGAAFAAAACAGVALLLKRAHPVMVGMLRDAGAPPCVRTHRNRLRMFRAPVRRERWG